MNKDPQTVQLESTPSSNTMSELFAFFLDSENKYIFENLSEVLKQKANKISKKKSATNEKESKSLDRILVNSWVLFVKKIIINIELLGTYYKKIFIIILKE